MKFLVCILFLGLAAAGIVEVEDCGKYCTTTIYVLCTIVHLMNCLHFLYCVHGTINVLYTI